MGTGTDPNEKAARRPANANCMREPERSERESLSLGTIGFEILVHFSRFSQIKNDQNGFPKNVCIMWSRKQNQPRIVRMS